MARRSASSAVVASTSTYSRSHEQGIFIAIAELPEEPEVVLPEHADVREAVAEHGDPLEPAAEREAGDLLRVVADVLEDVRVDDAGAAHLDPAGVPADAAALAAAEEARDVGLDRRLGEREVARPDADLALRAVELAREELDRALQVGERDPPVDGEALDLVEERRVRRVRRVAPVAAAEADHVDRRLVRLHDPDLARARSACAGAGRRSR